ncbi:uncharacterized protein TRIADDRAFT_64432 [Trichoplax adhaerens]|uniref:Expressed protein n=1 Tax=Trichoplax adhaerens TaxID=10228 RepID=B3SFB6_TRIAD|nr:expressed protein [Trichoplax adhaerens]EDV18579.1 expressed protein [Trichoplax adhaerens]|eukprot:XP_002118935.1 expressed protein [Trichoplax adhaerens]
MRWLQLVDSRLINKAIVSADRTFHTYYSQCLMQEYCCGGTSCCFAFYKVWYFWASIGFLILAFAAMITWLRYRRMQLERTHYIILQGEAAPGVIEKLGLSSNSNTQFCPPPYKS